MLDKYLEMEFIHQVPLRNFISTEAGFRCSCPVCNEGSHPNKRRCNILTKKYEWIQVTCFNCGLSTNFKEFLRQVSPTIFEDYEKKEKAEWLKNLREGKLNKKLQDGRTVINTNTPLQYQFELNEKYFRPAKNFEKAVEFCKKRKIIDYIDDFYYNINKKGDNGGMLIFPFYMEDHKTLYGFQGRHTEEKRFNTHSKNESFKVYNIFGVTKDKPVIAVESLIDSLNIDNSISMLGSDLSAKCQYTLRDYELIYAFDSDDTGLKKAVKYGDAGNKVFVWPAMGKIKDFNDLAKLGWTKEEITEFIKRYSYKGLELKARLTFESMKKRK
jgi:hypothetical protein